MTSRISIFVNDFNDDIQDLPVMSGNGVVSETGGALVVSSDGNHNMNWNSSGRNGKLPYVTVPIISEFTKVYYEFTVKSWTTTNPTYSHFVAALFQSDAILWILGSSDGLNFWVMKNWGTASASIATTLPRKFRFVWDRSNPISSTLTVQYQVSADPYIWADIVSNQAISMTPIGLGFGIKNTNTFPDCTVQYENTEIYAENDQFSLLDQCGIEDSVGTGTEIIGTGILSVDKLRNIDNTNSVEDEGFARLGFVPAYCPSTNDLEGHPFFLDTFGAPRLRSAFLYDATHDPWNNPFIYNLDGYGRDGHHYIGGIQQVTMAPWATEVVSADRSSRSDFPVRSLIVISQNELVIFDLDNWPTSIMMWMRFRLGDASNQYLVNRIVDSLRAVRMLNGTLMVGSQDNGTERGGLFCVDFKRTGTDFFLLVRSDGWWNGTLGRNITHRNQTGNWVSQGTGFKLDSEYVHYIGAAIDNSLANRERTWVVAGSEGLIRIVEILANQPQFDYKPVGTLTGPLNDLITGLKCSFFDSAGWLWLGWGSYVFRAIADFRGGVIVMGDNLGGSPEGRHRYVQLLHPSELVVVKSLTQVNESIYAATNVGVYRINRFTMEAYLCYTISGGLGGGMLNRPPAGELLGGEAKYTEWAKGFVVNHSGKPIGYLAVASAQTTFSSSLPTHGSGAVTLIRTYDDSVIDRRIHTGVSSGLTEDGAWFFMPFGT